MKPTFELVTTVSFKNVSTHHMLLQALEHCVFRSCNGNIRHKNEFSRAGFVSVSCSFEFPWRFLSGKHQKKSVFLFLFQP